MQNWLNTESRICSTSTTPMTSPTARSAWSRSTATYSPGQSLAQRLRARSAWFQGAAETIAMTSINRDRAFRSQILLANACQNFLFQLRQSVFGHARNSQCREILPVLSSGKSLLFKITISFGSLVAPLKCGGFGELRSAMWSRKSATATTFVCARFPHAPVRFPKRASPQCRATGSAHPPNWPFPRSYRASCRVCRWRSRDRSRATIEQTRFAGVCRTVNHHAHTFAQHTTLVGSREQHGDFISNRISRRRALRLRRAQCLPPENRSTRWCALAARSIHRGFLIWSPSLPSSCSVAERSARSVRARIKSITASAWVRSILPLRNARSWIRRDALLWPLHANMLRELSRKRGCRRDNWFRRDLRRCN
jgi:hypothetical protein